jgi:hypothetical protein
VKPIPIEGAKPGEVLKVLFRKWDHDRGEHNVVAIFPELVNTDNPDDVWYCSYDVEGGYQSSMRCFEAYRLPKAFPYELKPLKLQMELAGHIIDEKLRVVHTWDTHRRRVIQNRKTSCPQPE